MKIIVKESTFVRPAEDTPHERLWVSNMDLIHVLYHLPIVYLYRPTGSSSNFFDVQVLKDALSKVLGPFYPAAGRLGRDENGRIEIDCNAKGVLFIEAETEAPTSDLGDFKPGPELRQLVPTVDYSDITLYPLLLFQVTRFGCGGVCLGVGIHHTLTDGLGALSFINSWSNMARGQPIDIPPYLDHTILRARIPPIPEFHHIEYDPSPTLKTQPQDPKPTSMTNLVITPDQIKTLKGQVNLSGNKTSYSTYQILTAHIWRCTTKARGLSDDQATKLAIIIDGRSRFNPPIPAGYFGNVIFHATPLAMSSELLSESLLHTVERVEKAIERMDDNYLRSAIDYIEETGDVTKLMRGPHSCCNPNLTVTSWARLPFYDADFGSGRPLIMRPTNAAEGMGYLYSSPVNDGSFSLAICLEADYISSFEKLFYDLNLRNCKL